MVKENPYPAGKYELLGPWDKLVSEKGKPDEFVQYERGDIVDLTAEDAERFVGGEVKVAQKPGESQRRLAAALQAQADAAKLQAEQADAKVKAAEAQAAQVVKSAR